MRFFHTILVLLLAAGILVCPYNCLLGTCGASTSGEVQTRGCRCHKCQSQHNRNSALPADSDSSPAKKHCSACVCDGAVFNAAHESWTAAAPELAFGAAIVDALNAKSIAAIERKCAPDDPARPFLETGRAMRIWFESFLI